MTLGLRVAGTLPTFPCGGTCTTSFSGTMSPSGSATVTTGTFWIPEVMSVPDPTRGYVATFSIDSASTTGSAQYNEPGYPVCPGKGTAAGVATATGTATGIVSRASAPGAIALVYAVYMNAPFTYDRVGSAAVIAVRYGWMRVYFRMIDTGALGYLDTAIGGAGEGVFKVDPAQAVSACTGSGSVGYEVVAEIGIMTSTLVRFDP